MTAVRIDAKEREFYRRIGARIRQARQSRGWTQLQLSMRLEMTQVALHHYENGVNRPTLYRLRQIEKATGQEIVL